MKAKKTLLKYITVGGLMLCLAVVLVPFYIIISNSFKPYAEIAKHIFSLPQDFTTKNYSEAWRRLNFANSLKIRSLFLCFQILAGWYFPACAVIGLPDIRTEEPGLFFLC